MKPRQQLTAIDRAYRGLRAEVDEAYFAPTVQFPEESDLGLAQRARAVVPDDQSRRLHFSASSFSVNSEFPPSIPHARQACDYTYFQKLYRNNQPTLIGGSEN
jgi:hypothetical protein